MLKKKSITSDLDLSGNEGKGDQAQLCSPQLSVVICVGKEKQVRQQRETAPAGVNLDLNIYDGWRGSADERMLAMSEKNMCQLRSKGHLITPKFACRLPELMSKVFAAACQ